MLSLPLTRAPESQLTAERSSKGGHWNSPKKMPDVQGQGRSHNETVGGVQSQYNQIPWSLSWWLANWRTLIPQGSTHWSEGSEPHVRLPNLEVWQQEEEFLENQTLKTGRIWLWDFTRTAGSGDSTLAGNEQSSVNIRTQGREWWPHGRLNRTYLLVLEDLLQRQGVAHDSNKDTGSRSSGKYSLAWALLELAISPTRDPVGSGVGLPQAIKPTGREPSPTHQ